MPMCRVVALALQPAISTGSLLGQITTPGLALAIVTALEFLALSPITQHSLASIIVLPIAMQIELPLITPPAARFAWLIPMLITVLALDFALGDVPPILHASVILLTAPTSASLSVVLRFLEITLDFVSACLFVQVATTLKTILPDSVWLDVILAHMVLIFPAC